MTLSAGVIGLGVGEQHIVGYDSHPACKTTAICDIDPAKLREVGARFPACRQISDPTEIVCDPAIDVISICSYDDAHFAQVMSALDAGKHLFVEKPLCVTRDELTAIRTAHLATPGSKISSNLILRRSPRFMDLRSRIDKGEFGTVFLIEGDYNYGRLQKLTEGWRGRVPNYSVMLGGGVHIIDLMLWLTGDKVSEIAAVGSGLATRGTSYHGDDLRVAILKFESGMLAKISANFACVYPHHHRLSIYGTEATFENNVEGALLFTSRDPAQRPMQIDTAYPGVPKYALMDNFIDSILGKAEPLVAPAEIFESMDVCLRIDEAMQAG